MLGSNKKQKTPEIPLGEIFPSVEFDAIEKEFHLTVSGMKNGRKEYPESSHDGLDEMERKVVAYIGQIRQQGLKSAHEHEQEYRKRIMKCTAGDNNMEMGIQQILNEAETDFKKEVDAGKGQQKIARDDLHNSEADLQQFKEDNGLYRLAHETGGLMQWLAFCIVIVLIESIMNGFFFADANVAGIAGGIITALVISIVNVGAASVVGHICRQKNHIKSLRRFVGWVALVIGVGLAIFINFMVGHFRDLTSTFPWDEAAGEAFNRVIEGNLQMQSLDAWLLTGVGLLFAGIAGWKAYMSIDPYPGYTRVSDNYTQKEQEFQDQRQETLKILTDIRDKAATDLDDEYKLSQQLFESAQNAHTGFSSLMKNRHSFLQVCDSVVGDLLEFYRNANKKARKTPPPNWRPYSFPPGEEISPLEPGPSEPQSSLVKQATERVQCMCQEAMGIFDGRTDEHT